MTEWKDCRLGDILQFQRGFDLLAKDRHEGSIPVVSSSGITGYHNKAKADRPGVIIGRKGTLGTVHYIDTSYWPHDTTLWVKDFKGNSPRFIYYFLKLMHLENYDVGASNPTLNRNHIHKLKLRFPPLPVQRKIAAVLSAYDDLIENNTHRIALLEKMAEEIYREWFVRLRFPGHEQTVFHKGIPEGWEVKRLSELVTTQYGYTASAEDQEIGPKFLRITDIVPTVIDWSSVPYCKVPGSELKKYLLNEGDIVVARTGATVGYAKRIHKLHPSAVFASYLVRLKPKSPEESLFLGISVESDNFKNFISQFFTGSAQPQANAKVMTFYPLLYPGKDLIRRFNLLVEPIFDQKEILLMRNTILQETRDRLLTRLISGKLSVEDLDIQFPPSMKDDAPAPQG